MLEISISESNARAEALGRFVRWLYRRYQKLDLVEMANLPDPIELRQVFVPMRAGLEDLQEGEMGKNLGDIQKEELPGEDAWDLLARDPFVLLSGRPGSGKTTLVQAIVAELCGDRPSRFREATRAVPIPLILRSLGSLERVRTLDDLLDLWWPLQVEQAERDKMPLDSDRLRERLFPGSGSPEVPVLLLFDGIDEIGGREIRQQLLNIAAGAGDRGYRVVVTGRPTGYGGLLDYALRKGAVPLKGRGDALGSGSVPVLHYLLPFAWPQIERFIQSWYGLRDEWERQRQQGIHRFLGHLADRGRPHLLSLARRPIFLTLMALVHCTQNQMPEGRPLLYRQIIDLYLERQERHRQRHWSVDGMPMPHWPSTETRLVLGHLAWRSQSRVVEDEDWEPERRRVVWDRDEVEGVIRSQIERRLGRFDILQPADAPALVSYLLHPAGLLVEPAEAKIQFAHLSFQEYLCAWYLHEQGKVDEMRPYLKDNLFPYLDRPGWDEVGLLLLCIHAEETGRQGHFRLLRWLDLAQANHAALFIKALTGRELPFSVDERLAWLPIAFSCALIHPGWNFGQMLVQVQEWQQKAVSLLICLAKVGRAQQMWDQIRGSILGGLGRAEPPELTPKMEKRWLEPSNDESWSVSYGGVEAQIHSFLKLCNAGWFKAIIPPQPITEAALESALVECIEGHLAEVGPGLLWARENDIPYTTTAGQELDVILPEYGSLWRSVTRQIPVDGWLLQKLWCSKGFRMLPIPSVLLTIFPKEQLGSRNILALLLYQAQVLLESIADEHTYKKWGEMLSFPSIEPRVLSGALSLALLRRRLPLSFSGSSLSMLQVLSPSLSRSMDLVQLRPMMRMQLFSQWLWQSLRQSEVQLQPMAHSFGQSLLGLESLGLSKATKDAMVHFLTMHKEPSWEDLYEEPLSRLAVYGIRAAAFEWFAEQSRDPELMRRRGLLPGEPLPSALELLDKAGVPFTIQLRRNWLALREWLRDGDAILEFAFPGGLPKAERELLVADLAILQRQPWSPDLAVEALLADWPEEQPARNIRLDAADRAICQACQEALESWEKPKKRKSKGKGLKN